MTLQQKVIHKTTIPSAGLEEILNREGGDGWRLFDASPVVTNKGGAIYLRKNGYYFDDWLFLFNKSENSFLYKCISLRRQSGSYEKDMEEMNGTIAGLNGEGFELIKIFAPGVIGSMEDYPTKGALSYIMIFIKERE